MEVQNKNNIRVILYVLVLIAVFSIIFLIFKIEISNEKLEKNKVGLVDENTILPTPDRIIYKNINNEYIIINSGTSAYTQIYSELYNRITNTIEGKVYLEDKISQMQNNGSFIEFDYNSKSKNYVFMLNEKEIGIIKRFSDSGQVIQTSLPDKDKLIKKIDTITKDISMKYDFDTEYNLNSENKLSKVETNLNLSQTKVTGVYQKIIEYSEDEYNSILNKLNFKTNEEMPKVDFNKQTVIVTVSRYEIKDIKKNIGNIKYKLGNYLDAYNVNIYIISKVVNSKCIYFNIDSYKTNVSTFSTNNKENGVEYCVQNGKYYANINNKKTEILSIETATDIAEKETKKTKYQYQSWKSEFYRGESIDNSISGELILGLDDISRLYHWRAEWQNKEYEGKTMWKIRLFDKNDPLTSLYIYVDAINGEIIGAGASSD